MSAKKETKKTIVITGGYGVLGSYFCRAIAQTGANVVILGRNEKKAKNLEMQLTREGYQALAVVADVTNKDDLIQARDQIINHFGQIDVLINNAGGNNPSATTKNRYASEKSEPDDFFHVSKEAFSNVFDVNLIGSFLATQVLSEGMPHVTSSSIINISSMAAIKPLTKIPAYSAAKAAINNFTQWLCVYFASNHIRVNALAPGFFQTNQNRHLLFQPDGSLSDRSKDILSHTPMNRFGEPQDLVGPLLWLIDEKQSGFVSGVVLPIDGGFSAFGGI